MAGMWRRNGEVRVWDSDALVNFMRSQHYVALWAFFPVSQGARTWERVLPHELLVFVSTQDPMAPCSFRFRVFLQSYSYDIWTCAKAGLRHGPSIEFIRLDVALIIDDYCLFYLPQAGWGCVFHCIWGITCWSMLTFSFSVCLRL